MQALRPDDMTFAPLKGEIPRGLLSIGSQQMTLDGARIEAAYHLRAGVDPIDGYLLFTSDDVLYEDVLTITLTDGDLRPLDGARIGAPYDSAVWQGSRIAGPGQVEFSLDRGGDWRLTVLAAPEWRLPLPGTDGWLWRGMRMRRWFRLTARPDTGARSATGSARAD